jgi:TrpR-related protein YerC/YecD
MSRVQPKSLSKEEKKELLNILWSMITILESREEVESFFRDLLSETEAVMLARRVAIAQLLIQGKTYDYIALKMDASSTTVARVHRWLQRNTEGYQKLVPELEKELRKQKKYKIKQAKQKERYSFEWLKKRYPLHFLLLNLIDINQIPNTKKRKRKKR